MNEWWADVVRRTYIPGTDLAPEEKDRKLAWQRLHRAIAKSECAKARAIMKIFTLPAGSQQTNNE